MSYQYQNVINRIHPGWLNFFEENKLELEFILNQVNESAKSNNIFPLEKNLFRTLFYFSPEETKLVIIGQDPYIGYETHNGKIVPQACGFSFGVPKKHMKIPPSLVNIFKELDKSFSDFSIQTNGWIGKWVKQENILLLNSALTVCEKKSNSHQKLWTKFTDKLIKWINDNVSHTVFLLMGNYAIGKSKLIDESKHKIFTTVHPSPLSASNGFFGSNIFVKINEYLTEKQICQIDWNL